MYRAGAAVLATVGAIAAISACGGYNPTDAVNSLNKQLNDTLQSSLKAAGVPASAASQAGITVKCPDSVEKGQSFDCSVTGKASGKSVDVPMEINDNDELVPVAEEKLNSAVQSLSEAEASKAFGQ